MNPLLALLLTSIASPRLAQEHGMSPGIAVGAVHFAPDVEAELEVTRARTGHMLVRPAVNGHEAGWFIFDTGAGICVVSTPAAESLELGDLGALPAEGAGGTTTTRAARADLLELGPMTLEGVPMMLTDLSFLREHLGVEIAGVIGHGLLSRCVFELDLKAPRIALHDPEHFELTTGSWTPLEFDELVPTVGATFEGHTGRFHLDIGSNVPLTFQEPAVRRYDLLAGRTLAEAKLGGVGGFIAAKSGKLASFELAGVHFDGIEATFPLEAKGVWAAEGRDGSIGTKPLESFLLTFDYPGGRICFRPRGE